MKILLVEDDALYRSLIQKALGKNGYEITCAVDGLDAFEKMKAASFDLIITDIFLPHKEGIEVIQEIKDAYPQMKVVAISSGGQAGHTTFLKIAETVGADACLQKPFTPEQLLPLVERLIAG